MGVAMGGVWGVSDYTVGQDGRSAAARRDPDAEWRGGYVPATQSILPQGKDRQVRAAMTAMEMVTAQP